MAIQTILEMDASSMALNNFWKNAFPKDETSS